MRIRSRPAAVLVYDGVCNICNFGVRTASSLDADGSIWYVALQSNRLNALSRCVASDPARYGIGHQLAEALYPAAVHKRFVLLEGQGLHHAMLAAEGTQQLPQQSTASGRGVPVKLGRLSSIPNVKHTHRSARRLVVRSGGDAALRVGELTGGVVGLAASIARSVAPASLVEATYDFVAANRYAWFGRTESCQIPPSWLADRMWDMPRREEPTHPCAATATLKGTSSPSASSGAGDWPTPLHRDEQGRQ